jgi:GWxTD domain-containing protein
MEVGMKQPVICTLLGLLISVATPVSAQLSPDIAAWREGPIGELLTAEERAAFDGLAEDQEAFAFIRSFWARRDPDRNTPVNELIPDIAARIRAADRQLTEGDLPGSQSDRGKVLLLLGTPSRRQTGSIASYLDALFSNRTRFTGNRDPILGMGPHFTPGWVQMIPGSEKKNMRDVAPDARFRENDVNSSNRQTIRHGVSFNLDTGHAEIWIYEAEDLPAGIELDHRQTVSFAFFDCQGNGEYRLRTDIRGGELSRQVLAAAPATFITNPAQ